MSSGRCAACKFLRQRCAVDCIFSPYFPCNDPQRFAYVHRIYGASNVAKMIQNLTHREVPEHLRRQAVDTLYWEAQCRVANPVYGCVGFVHQLHQHIRSVQMELARTQAQITFLSNYHHIVNGNHNHHQQEHQQFQQSSSNVMPLPMELYSTHASNWFI